MLKVLKNLKESWLSVVVIVALLCVQATVDLELPNYTSKIVNTGIQAGGIEYASPDIITKKDMDSILLFTDADEKILENYSLANSNDLTQKQEKTLTKYLKSDYEESQIYVIKDLNKNEKDELSDIMTKPIIISQTIQSSENLMSVPQEQAQKMLEESAKQIDEMQDSIKTQAAIVYVKNIYKNAGIDTDNVQMNYIVISGLKMLVLAAISMASGITIMMLSSRVGARLSKTLREKVFNKVLSFSNKELREFSTASLITRSTNDVQQIQQLMAMLFRTVVYAPIIGIGGTIKVLTESNSSMAWIIGLAVITIMIVVGMLFAIAMPKFKKLQDLVDKLNNVSREILTGLPVIRAFNTEKKEN